MKISSMPSIEQKSVLLSGGLALLVGVFFYFNVYAPAAAEIEEIQGKLDSRLVRLDETGADSKTLELIQANVSDLDRQIKLQARRLPDQERFEEVVSFVYTVGDQSRINVERLTLSGTRIRDADYVSIPLQVDFTGPYSGLVEFLTRLENARHRIFVVDNILLTTELAGTSLLRGRIDVRTYYRGDHDREAML